MFYVILNVEMVTNSVVNGCSCKSVCVWFDSTASPVKPYQQRHIKFLTWTLSTFIRFHKQHPSAFSSCTLLIRTNNRYSHVSAKQLTHYLEVTYYLFQESENSIFYHQTYVDGFLKRIEFISSNFFFITSLYLVFNYCSVKSLKSNNFRDCEVERVLQINLRLNRLNLF